MQAEFQAAKKLSGNTHTVAKNYMFNRGAAAFMLVGCGILAVNGLTNLALGRNKIQLKD